MRIDDQILDRIAIIEAKTILGDKLPELIARYIEDTRGMLADIEIARSAGSYEDVFSLMVRMKTISAYVGARKVMVYAAELEQILAREMHTVCLELEEKIDRYISLIRDGFDHYQKQVALI